MPGAGGPHQAFVVPGEVRRWFRAGQPGGEAGLKLRAESSEMFLVGYSNQATTDGGRRPRTEARSYDFRRPVRLARGDSHKIKVAMATFGRQATTQLTTNLRTLSLLSLVEVDEMSYDEYIATLPEASVTAVLSMEPLVGKALMSVDLGTLMVVVDRLLGGTGKANQPERPLTEIEQNLSRYLFGKVLRELGSSFQTICEVRPVLVHLESNPQFIQAAAPTDPVVVSHLQLMIGDRISGIDLCLPYSMLSAGLATGGRNVISGDRVEQRSAAVERTTRRLNDVEVDVSIRFDPLRLPSSQIGRLSVGDILNLGHRTSRPLTITSASSTFALAVPGTSGRQLAALIVTDN